MAMRVAASVVEQRLNADTSDHAGPMLPCACGHSARYAGRHGKDFESVLGPLRLERAYYHYELCEAGLCPRDRALGLEGGSLSPGVLRMAGLVGAMVSLEEGHELLHELAGVDVPTDDEARKCIDYVERNRERMRYPKFRAAGLCTSTGVVEAGCKVAIGTRCKRAGMHWTVAGVDAIIALRCCKLSGRFEGFWERRAQRRVA